MPRTAVSRIRLLIAITCGVVFSTTFLMAGAAGAQVFDTLRTTADISLTGVNENDLFGQAVCFGDFNGDDREDMIVGAPKYDLPGRDNCGVIYVLLASDTLSQAIDAAAVRPDLKRIFGPAADVTLGTIVTCGDINNDGNDDIVCGLPGGSLGSFGSVYIIFGADVPADTVDLAAPSMPVTHIIGKEIGQLGSSLAIGDVDNDTFGDVVTGAAFAQAPGRFASGKVFVIFGSANPDDVIDLATTSSRFSEIFGEAQNYQFGDAVCVADVNDDTIDDIIAGSPGAEPLGRLTAGTAYIVPGQAVFPDTIDTAEAPANGVTRIFGPANGALAGSGLVVGNFTGDALNDVAVGAPDYSPMGRAQAGSVFIVEGRSSWPDTIDLAGAAASAGRIDGPGTSLTIGLVLATADLNMDGLDDVAIGVPKATPSVGRSRAGEAYVVFGRPVFNEPIDLAANLTGVATILGEETDNSLGISLAAGRSTMSGFDDLFIGASGVTIGGQRSVGRAYVLLGNPAITPTQVVFYDAAAMADGVLLTWILADDVDALSMSVSREDRETGHVQVLARSDIRRTGSARYELFDASPPPGRTYRYTVVLATEGQILFRTDVSTPRVEAAQLHPGYPNPFRDHTTISFDVTESGRVALRVYDVTGALVRVLREGLVGRGTGEATWDGRNHLGQQVPTGIYFIHMNFRGMSYRQKIVILR